MKRIAAILLLFALIFDAKAQTKKGNIADSLSKLILVAKDDTTKALLYIKLGDFYVNTKPDTGLLLLQKGAQLSQRADFLKGEARSLNGEGLVFTNTGNYPNALNYLLASLKINEKLGNSLGVTINYNNIGNILSYEDEHRQAIGMYFKAKTIAERLHNEYSLGLNLANIGNQYCFLRMPDSALKWELQAFQLAFKMKKRYQLGFTTRMLGEIYSTMNKNGIAMNYFRKSLLYSGQYGNDYRGMGETLLRMAKIYKRIREPDSSLYYARWSMNISLQRHFTGNALEASMFLADYFKSKGRLDSAFHYQQITLAAKDSLFSQEKTKQVFQLNFAEKERQSDFAIQAAMFQSKIRFYILLGIALFLLALSVTFWHNNHKINKAKKLLQQQKEQIQITLGELEITQEQLIQSAKMASLGELTAGIAHEIQNPLNFVNNFSEVSSELLQELKDEAEAGNTQDIMAIADELKLNLEKINHHGKRADNIVKSMMAHSRNGSGERAPGNVNAIADEFLKLSYHGLRAKDKSFNAELIEHFDEALPRANIVQQDIGRVFANILNNAFYAVYQKHKKASADYKPTVTVTTSSQNGQVAVKIKDNGDGIPDNIIDKIMQPFFTTKPTGEGTGLGLSLSYDIVVKGHGGSICVNTKHGEFTEFVVCLPV